MLEQFYKYLLKNQVILALFIVVLGWFVFQIRGILISVFFSYIIMAAMLPGVEFLRKKGLPKVFAILIPYMVLTVLVFALVFPLIPFFAEQIVILFKNLPQYLDQAAKVFGYQVDPKQLQNYVNGELDNIGKNLFTVTGRVFGGIISVLTVIIISFYLLFYRDDFKKSLASLFEKDTRDKVFLTLAHVDDKLGAWLRGQLLLSFSIGLVSFISLSLLGIPYALPLALIAGLLEVVPTIGPIISAVPAIIVAFTISPTMGIIVTVLYFVIQMLENQILVPKIMERAVGLNPIFVILGIAIGANLLGVAGALLIVPFISFVLVLYNGIMKSKNQEA